MKPCILFFCGVTALASGATKSESEPVVELDPYSVSAMFPAVEIRFALAGEILADPMLDRVKRAYIAVVVLRGLESAPDLFTGDQVEAIAGEVITGKSLRDIATLLTQARAKGVPEWRLSRGGRTRTVRFDGDWLVPLPGLKR